jgi:hypothetical protein
LWWSEWIAQGATVDQAELLEELRCQPTGELAKLSLSVQHDTFLSYIRWGSEQIASAAPEQREAVIEAIVRQDTTTMYGGAEPLPVPTAGGCLDQAPVFWARARREQLDRLLPQELAAECRKMLDAATEMATRHNDIIASARSDASRRMSDLVRPRYSYRPSLIEAAVHCRQQKVRAKRASIWLAKRPFECITGNVVTFEDNRFVVKQGDQVLGGVREAQFRKEYWPLGKIPPTS